MGKRRDKTGRRQKLQLHDEKPPVNATRNPLQKLMQYSDSEDEDNKVLNNETTSSNDSKQDSTRQIDLEVADFLKEIDELNPNNEEINNEDSDKSNLQENSCQVEQHSAEIQSDEMKLNVQDSAAQIHNTQDSNKSESVCNSENYGNSNGELYTSWQHCYDEGSGYTYFWNVDTNEVTWECPQEYSNYFHSIDKTTLLNSSKDINFMRKQAMKRKLETKSHSETSYEGKITPITYFEPHVSSDDSSEEEKIQMKSSKKLKIQGNSNQHNLKNLKDTGPKVQGCALEKCSILKKTATQDSDYPIGPQLPSYYKPREPKTEEEEMSNTNEAKTEILSSSQTRDTSLENQPVHSLKESLRYEKEQDKSDKALSRKIKSDHIYDQEPDSTTRKESTSVLKKKEGCNNGVKPMTKKVFRTLVQYAESGSEDEKDETPAVYNSETYRQDGRQGLGFKECSSTNTNWSKSEKDVEKDYPMISFIKSNEILDLNKLYQQKTENIKSSSNFSTSIKHNLNITGSMEFQSKQKHNENLDSSDQSKNENTLTCSGDAEVSKKQDKLKSIQDLSSIMLDKLSFLTTGQAELTSLYQLLLQLQTRYTDWKENALNSSYFLNKLQEVQDFLRQYEMNAMPSGWICDWDRQHKRYFYVNERTGHTQWEYPQIVAAQMHTEAISECSVSNGVITPEGKTVQLPQHSFVSSSVPEAMLSQIAAVSSVYTTNTGYPSETTWSSRLTNHESESPPPSPPGVDKPLQPPLPPLPPLPPPNSPPPPPPDSTDLEDGEIADVEMEIDSDDQCDDLSISTSVNSSSDIKTESQASASQSLLSSSVSVVSANITDNIVISKTPNNSPLSFTEDKLIHHNLVTSVIYPHPSLCLSTSEPTSNKIQDSTPASSLEVLNTSNIPPKKEKKKCKLSSGLTLKKKNIPSLVQKWQKIKEEQDKDSGNSGVLI